MRASAPPQPRPEDFRRGQRPGQDRQAQRSPRRPVADRGGDEEGQRPPCGPPAGVFGGDHVPAPRSARPAERGPCSRITRSASPVTRETSISSTPSSASVITVRSAASGSAPRTMASRRRAARLRQSDSPPVWRKACPRDSGFLFGDQFIRSAASTSRQVSSPDDGMTAASPGPAYERSNTGRAWAPRRCRGTASRRGIRRGCATTRSTPDPSGASTRRSRDRRRPSTRTPRIEHVAPTAVPSSGPNRSSRSPNGAASDRPVSRAVRPGAIEQRGRFGVDPCRSARRGRGAGRSHRGPAGRGRPRRTCIRGRRTSGRSPPPLRRPLRPRAAARSPRSSPRSRPATLPGPAPRVAVVREPAHGGNALLEAAGVDERVPGTAEARAGSGRDHSHSRPPPAVRSSGHRASGRYAGRERSRSPFGERAVVVPPDRVAPGVRRPVGPRAPRASSTVDAEPGRGRSARRSRRRSVNGVGSTR